MNLAPKRRERTLILAPRGRDAVVAKRILHDAQLRCAICLDLVELLDEIKEGAEVAVVTEEELTGPRLLALDEWVAAQPPWSDFPFVILTKHGGGPERNPAALELISRLGNVTLLERPFHPTTLVSLVQASLRSRRRQ